MVGIERFGATSRFPSSKLGKGRKMVVQKPMDSTLLYGWVSGWVRDRFTIVIVSWVKFHLFTGRKQPL